MIKLCDSVKNGRLRLANKLLQNIGINIPARIGESRTTLANNGKLRTIFGWRPQVNLMDWIKTQ